jgi:hypothetical protein
MFNAEFVLFICMVEDFSIACKHEKRYSKLCDLLDKNWQVPMSRYGMMKYFNDIDISQFRTRVSISSKTYLDTVFKKYDWNDIIPTSLPMNPSNEFARALDYVKPLEPTQRSHLDSTRFRYRAVIGELIWTMITMRPELSYPIVKFIQFSPNPAMIHYNAVYGIFQDLYGTHNDGLTYTRPKPMTWGPVVKHTPIRCQPTARVDEHITKENLHTMYGYSDANWDMDIRHHRSISGMVFFLAGAVVSWKTRVQPKVALSKAESEFLAASDNGRLGLFIRAVLDELLQHQCASTAVYEENNECRIVADSTAPIRQMHHITIRDFALQDWTEMNRIALMACASNVNVSDLFTKQVGKKNVHVKMITFPAVPRSFGSPDLLLVPRYASGARGGC